jgi:GR25 family glycosyltransferase involved in LPS biosynthesis
MGRKLSRKRIKRQAKQTRKFLQDGGDLPSSYEMPSMPRPSTNSTYISPLAVPQPPAEQAYEDLMPSMPMILQPLQGGGHRHTSLFQDAYTITLPSNPERWDIMIDQCRAANIDLKKWDGVTVNKEEIEKLIPLGVGSTNFRDRMGRIFNLGVIGAFLAHRNLFHHITRTGHGKLGTFISEDDIHILPDLHDKLIGLEDEINTHASDWDIIFLDKNIPTIQGRQVSEHLLKLDKDMSGFKNWGIWSYIVRNDIVEKKILPCMEHMLDVPDIQLAKFADKINMYLITPSLTYGHPLTAPKSIVTVNDST